MPSLAARIAPTWGTLAELNASTIILEKGERWFRTDAPVVTDVASPFNGLPDPARQWKTGDGTKRWNQITNYDPIGTGSSSSSGGLPTMSPLTVLANPSDDTDATAVEVPLLPDPLDDTVVNLLGLLGAMGTAEQQALLNQIGSLTPTEVDAGGVKGILDRFMALAPPPALVIANCVTTTSSPTVTVPAPGLPTDVREFDPVSATTGIPANSYIGSIAPDRLSFTLTAEIFNLSGTGTALNATATGARSVTIKRIGVQALGLYLAGVLSQQVYTGIYTLRSTPNALQSTNITGDTTQLRVKDGVISVRAAQVQSGAWEQLNDQVDQVLHHRQVVAAVAPQTHHNWASQPAAATEFLGENGTAVPFRHRFSLTIPDPYYSQFMLGIDNLIAAGATNSKLYIEYWDSINSVWADITTVRVETPLTGTLDAPTQSPLGTLAVNAKQIAALNTSSKSIRCRIMGNAGAGTGTPQFGNVWVLVK